MGLSPASKLLMLDPSFLLSADGIAWFERDESAREGIIIPATVWYWLTSARPDGDAQLLPLVGRGNRDAYYERSARLAQILEGVQVFRFDSVDLPGPSADVMRSLLGRGGIARQVLAEEWAFLQSSSWLLSKVRRPINAFRDAGAIVVEYGAKLRDEMIELVMPHEPIPAILTPELLAKAAAKWLLVGGAGAAAAPLGPAGAALAPLSIPVVRALDP
jgi:hypothetical protein